MGTDPDDCSERERRLDEVVAGYLHAKEAGAAAEPHRIGKFELLRKLGQGTYGTVYKAWDTQLGRVVALKVPRSDRLATDEDLERFFREGRNVARLHHPAIVPVYEVDEAD